MATHTGRLCVAAGLCRVLVRADFVVKKMTDAKTFSLPVAICQSMLYRNRPGRQTRAMSRSPAWQNALFSRLLFAEAWCLRDHNVPFGLSPVAIGRRPGEGLQSSRGQL